MAPTLSLQSHAALFGGECDLTTHSEHLEAAKCFFEVRKAMERKKANLASLTTRQFNNHRTSFVERAARCIKKGDVYNQLLMPLITNDPTINGFQRFILVCSILSIKHTQDLQNRGLVSIFPQLVISVINTVDIPQGSIGAIVDALQDVCTDADTSEPINTLDYTLRDFLSRVWKNSKTSNNPESDRPTKRARLNEKELHTCASCEDRDIEPLEFSPEFLNAVENEVLNLNESPEFADRHIISQFARAKADRIVGVFGTSPLFQALKTSRQWRWERAQDTASSRPQGQTNCLIALLPNSDMNDFSFVIKVGNKTGWAIIDYLEYAESIDPTINT
ncbi:hypothetical protein FOCG_17886 [Fusarium oxysporum f. sp. radicis-lycopersici 26381]|nr:hypothetical protein FOCG_17886 [Fusarium oxysporum f. sp. radicis-lycopersici 26381]